MFPRADPHHRTAATRSTRDGIRRVVVAFICVAATACTSGASGASGQGPSASARSEPRPHATDPPGGPTDGAGSTPDDSSGFPDAWQPTPLQWQECAVARDAQCADLEVPLDWDDPLGPMITLAVARTTAEGERIGSLVTNPGGPGGSGLEYLGYEPFGPEITRRFDVVSWDPRGVGSSTALSCGEGVPHMQSLDHEPDDARERQELERAAASISQECAATDGEMLPHVGTDDVARDMEAIRRALGDEPLNYIGFSYGTQIGQVYAEMFPEQIRTMVLDAIVDPALGYEQFLVEQAVAFEESFERNARACRAAGAAECGVPELADAYDQVMTQVERRPLGQGTNRVGPSELTTAAILTSYGPDGWQSLGPALGAALDGDGDSLRYLADSYRDFGGFTSYAAVVCIDTPPPDGPEEYAEFAQRAGDAAPRFGVDVANELLSCATWPAEPVGEPVQITAAGAPPILVVGNTGDAATPYENAVSVAERLESGVLVTAEMDGHVGYGASVCVTDYVDTYLVHLELPEADPRCT